MTYDEATERALDRALNGDELHQEALDQWAEAALWYEPTAYLRGSHQVTEVSGYVGNSILVVLADIEASR